MRHKPYIHSFPPIAAPKATLLVLGSMPGNVSLLANQYYARSRNVFWSIMVALFGAGPDAPYARRVRVLKQAGVAVWDVLASCTRQSSLDSNIDEDSIVPNDFASFFRERSDSDKKRRRRSYGPNGYRTSNLNLSFIRKPKMATNTRGDK